MLHLPSFEPPDSVSYRIGADSEQRALVALQQTVCSPERPFWLLGARKGSQIDDQLRKTDIWLETPFGDIPLQIKSSGRGAQKFFRLYGRRFPKVVVVVIFLTYEPSDIILAIDLSLKRRDERFRHPPPPASLGLVL